MDAIGLSAIGIFGAVFAVVLVAVLIVKRYVIAKPNQAIIVTGGRAKPVEVVLEDGTVKREMSSQRVITGGGVFVIPLVQKSFELSLESRQLELASRAQTRDGITITANAVAVVKVGGTNELIRDAAQRFLSDEARIKPETEKVLSGALRGMIGTLTVEQIMNDRAAVAAKVLTVAEDALTKQGLVIDTLQIDEIKDEQDYIANRGRPEAARVLQEGLISEAKSRQASEAAQLDADQIILDRQREYDLREAAIKVETSKAKAASEAAEPLEEARQAQAIVDQQQITAQKRVALKEQELNSSIRAVADAEAYRDEIKASAAAKATVLEANGKRDSQIAQAEADKATGLAQAEALLAVGDAEARNIESRGKALEGQSEQILSQEFIKIFPEVVKNYAGALGAIGNMTVVSSDGASAVSGQTMGGIKGAMEMAKETLGIDVPGMMNGAFAGSAAGSAAARSKRIQDHEMRDIEDKKFSDNMLENVSDSSTNNE